jgi:Ser/Thr protein kinase RdoA (MazF antagonist)
LHFGNLLAVGTGIGAIDFDDCGFGFYVYDLVIPYISMQNILGKKRKKKFALYKNALIDGYKSVRSWDQDDEQLFPHLVTARKLLMLGWLNSRSDNPRLKKHLKGAIKRALEHISLENIA